MKYLKSYKLYEEKKSDISPKDIYDDIENIDNTRNKLIDKISIGIFDKMKYFGLDKMFFDVDTYEHEFIYKGDTYQLKYLEKANIKLYVYGYYEENSKVIDFNMIVYHNEQLGELYEQVYNMSDAAQLYRIIVNDNLDAFKSFYKRKDIDWNYKENDLELFYLINSISGNIREFVEEYGFQQWFLTEHEELYPLLSKYITIDDVIKKEFPHLIEGGGMGFFDLKEK